MMRTTEETAKTLRYMARDGITLVIRSVPGALPTTASGPTWVELMALLSARGERPHRLSDVPRAITRAAGLSHPVFGSAPGVRVTIEYVFPGVEHP